MEVINYLLAIDVDENNIVDTIINNYFNVDQRREFNKHIYKLFVAGVTDADEEIELPNSEFGIRCQILEVGICLIRIGVLGIQ